MIYMYIERHTNRDFDRIWLGGYYIGLHNVKMS